MSYFLNELVNCGRRLELASMQLRGAAFTVRVPVSVIYIY